ncbi:alkaline phosphatase family protein [Flaviaesturariibacter flavus]|uniref:Alkaline phosphatase family protein n=1 Tax=Flaviaesturariibacter flavus TaxID=2502780 RepID=A0A4R1B967_9BACT|nr:alkaline phosphatase D family protein [Flaviaesturariibacter flavus]TCJ13253.1 alkaline phosphatase family protein [Flaviaesturariibacter flavus]
MSRLLLAFLALISLNASAQVISGPMLGPVELRDAIIWLEVAPTVRSVKVVYTPVSNIGKKVAQPSVTYTGKLGAASNPVSLVLADLEPNTVYNYSIIIDGKAVPGAGGAFRTKELWQWRKPAPDFSFLTGSCAYFNEPVYDRPGTPYGGDSSIFLTMAKENAAFTLWLGDNWYYREVDFFSPSGLWYRARRDRAQPVLQPLLRKMPHYAIWDDHDFGPNDSDKSYTLREESRKVFTSYWPNSSAGSGGEGIYTKVSYGDVDIFMMDDRWFRSANAMNPDDSSGAPNAAKRMWGAQQLEWLKNALLSSNATFKIIATGNQTLNPMARAECLQDYPAEFNEFLSFLRQERIDGLLFLTGDRHHSEVIRWERPGSYPLYDVTNSPFTSGISKVTGTPEAANPARIGGTLVEAQNYSRVRVSGAGGKRRLQVEFVGIDGRTLGAWSVSESELKTPAAR